MTEVAALILAAGKGTRFQAAAGVGSPPSKLVARLDGEPLIRHVARAALASRARPVIVVTGHARDDVLAAVKDLAVETIHNPDFADGLSTSLRVGVAALPPKTYGVIVLLGDMPRISGDLIDCIVAAFENAPDVKAVVPVMDGRRGNPVLLSRRLFSEVARLSGDLGARPLLSSAGNMIVELPIDDEAIQFDVDTPDAIS